MSMRPTPSGWGRPPLTLPIALNAREGLVILAVSLIGAPFLLPDYQLTLFATGAAYSVAVLGVALGFTSIGMLALTQPAMMLIGAYIALYIVDVLQLSFVTATGVATLVCVLIAIPLGWLTCRLDKFSFAVLGFAFTYLVAMLMSSSLLVTITGGELGKPFPTSDIFGISLQGDASYIALSCFVFIAFLSAPLLFRSTMGRVLIVMRQDDVLAKSIGIDTNLHRILLTAIVSGYGALSGALIGLASGFIAPPQFDVALSISLLAMALVGGTRYLLGAAAGTVILQVLPAILGLSQVDRNLLVGVVLLACLIFIPDGVLSLLRLPAWPRWLPTSAAPPRDVL
jgi:branched-chain amino acid transport system permease protein